MNWQVVLRPEVEQDVAKAAQWYDDRQPGLGLEFTEEVIQVWQTLSVNPLLNCIRHPAKNFRWCFPRRFPYRIIYEVVEAERIVIVAAVLHAARHDRDWRRRI